MDTRFEGICRRSGARHFATEVAQRRVCSTRCIGLGLHRGSQPTLRGTHKGRRFRNPYASARRYFGKRVKVGLRPPDLPAKRIKPAGQRLKGPPHRLCFGPDARRGRGKLVRHLRSGCTDAL